MRSALIASLLALAPWVACSAQPAPAPAPSEIDLHFETRLAEFDAADHAAALPAGGMLFVGSSSIRLWPQLESQFEGFPVVIKRGIGGSRIDQITRHLAALVLRYRPRLVLVYAGDNDIAEGRSPQSVLVALKEFVSGVHAALPGTRIAYISIKPCPLRRKFMPLITQANALIRAYAAADPGLDFIDVFTPMLGPDGKPRSELFRPDGLHLNDIGYALWRSIIAQRIHPAS